jgi:hypothetical protein
MPAARQINIQKSNRLVTQAALERASAAIGAWRQDAFLSQGAALERQSSSKRSRPCQFSRAGPKSPTYGMR